MSTRTHRDATGRTRTNAPVRMVASGTGHPLMYKGCPGPDADLSETWVHQDKPKRVPLPNPFCDRASDRLIRRGRLGGVHAASIGDSSSDISIGAGKT
jgi:hypothetical protein